MPPAIPQQYDHSSAAAARKSYCSVEMLDGSCGEGSSAGLQASGTSESVCQGDALHSLPADFTSSGAESTATARSWSSWTRGLDRYPILEASQKRPCIQFKVQIHHMQSFQVLLPSGGLLISIHKPVNRLMQEKKKLVMVKRMLNNHAFSQARVPFAGQRSQMDIC